MVEEYARSLTELEADFGTGEACRAYWALFPDSHVHAADRGRRSRCEIRGVCRLWLPGFGDAIRTRVSLGMPHCLTLGRFDERFLHQFEDSDLCLRVWKAGYSVRFCPDAEIVHIGGQNRGRYPIRVILETERSKYKNFYKHYGERAARRIRWISLMAQAIRYFGCWLPLLVKGRAAAENKRELHRVLLTWNWNLDPMRFVTTGEETDVGYAPLITAPKTNPHTVGAKQA